MNCALLSAMRRRRWFSAPGGVAYATPDILNKDFGDGLLAPFTDPFVDGTVEVPYDSSTLFGAFGGPVIASGTAPLLGSGLGNDKANFEPGGPDASWVGKWLLPTSGVYNGEARLITAMVDNFFTSWTATLAEPYPTQINEEGAFTFEILENLGALSVHYVIPPGGVDHQDSNRFAQYDAYAHGLRHFFAQGMFVLPTPIGDAGAFNRKQIYLKGGEEAWSAGIGIDSAARTLSAWATSPETLGSAAVFTPFVPYVIDFDTAYILELEWKANSAFGVADGELRVWITPVLSIGAGGSLNLGTTTLVIEETGIKLIEIEADFAEPLHLVELGRQVDRFLATDDVDEYRLWRTLKLSTLPIGPRPLPAGTFVAFAVDTFTDDEDIGLQSHPANWGGTWELHPTTSSAAAVITNAGRVRNWLGGGWPCIYTLPIAPGSPNYRIECDFNLLTLAGGFAGFMGRTDAVDMTGLLVRYNEVGELWELYEVIEGGFELLDSSALPAFATDAVVRIVMEMEDELVNVYANDDLIMSAATTLSAAGRVGVWFYTAGDATEFTGTHLDNLEALAA